MKNIVLSAVAVLAMGSFAVAGGNIAPIEEPIVVPEPVVDDSGFYLGLAYGYGNFDIAAEAQVDDGNGFIVGGGRHYAYDASYNSIMVQAGYKFNSYVAVEGRYWFGLDESVSYFGDFDLSVDTWGIYVKPMYPVTYAFDIYALLGYASSDATESWSGGSDDYNTKDGFSWGLGAAYSFNDNVAIFVDYVSMYNDDEVVDNWNEDITISTWNFGVTYQF